MLKDTGERQVEKYLINVDQDHRERYALAAKLVEEGYEIADIGCGIGYGSYYMAMASPCKSITGIDLSSDAINYAKEFFNHEKVDFVVLDITNDQMTKKYDLITVFEVIEHIDHPLEFIIKIENIMKENGVVVLSTPNEDVLHFDLQEFKYHKKHYTPFELEKMLNEAGLEVVIRGSQNGGYIYGFTGNGFNIFVCRKKTAELLFEKKSV